MSKHSNIAKSKSERSVIYDRLCGMCADGKIVDPEKRYAYLENMYQDPDSSDGSVESIPGFRILKSFEGPIHSIFSQKINTGTTFLLIHAKDKLYRINLSSYRTIGNVSPIATLADQKSHSYILDGKIYILDGETIISVDRDGNAESVYGAGAECYVPLTYKDGEPLEERNLLSERFRESTRIQNADDYAYGTPELIYSVTDAYKKECAVVGISDGAAGEIYIPAYTYIDGERFEVKEIREGAFVSNTKITAVTIANRVEKIGRWAFWGATNLTRVAMYDSVRAIGDRAFYQCSSLTTLYLGASLESFGVAAFSGCSKLSEIYYALNEESYNSIEMVEVLGSIYVHYLERWDKLLISVPVFSPAESIDEVKMDGKAISYKFDPINSVILLSFTDGERPSGKVVNVAGRYRSEDSRGFISTSAAKAMTPFDAILKSTVCKTYDGRVFLSGNPLLGGTVFYSATTEDGRILPDYFGNESFFVDGGSDYSVSSMMISDGDLVVLKNGDDGMGGVFYHTPKGEGINKKYEVVYTHGKIFAKSKAYSFLDDSIFLSDLGLVKLKRQQDGYRQITLLSEDVHPLMKNHPPAGAEITEWRGYLVIAIGGNIFLADARHRFSGTKKEYDWYYLSGIGTYKNDTRVYRYSHFAPEGFIVSDRAGEATEEVVMSAEIHGKLHYFVQTGNDRVYLDATEEFAGGDFYPLSAILGDGDLLFFGTEAGDLCIFNNDMRGTAPKYISESENFDPAEYESVMGDKLHPSFYSFAGHAPRFCVCTAEDDAGIPYLEKYTVPHSTAVRFKNLYGGEVKCSVITEAGRSELGELPLSGLCFEDIDAQRFTNVTAASSTVLIPDRSCGWIRKQICLYSDKFCAPFGVYSISYRYKIKGTIKKSGG